MASFENLWIPLGDALAAYFESRKLIGEVFIEKRFENGAEVEVPTLTWSSVSMKELNQSISRAASLGEILLRGVKVNQRDAPQYGSLKDIPADYFRVTRHFVEQRNEIEPFTGEESEEAFSVARKLGKRNPKWIDVVTARARFESWLNKTPDQTRPPAATGAMIALNHSQPPHRSPEIRDAVIAVLREIEPTVLKGKRVALLAEVNNRVRNPVSMDTLRRALKQVQAEG